MDTREQIEQYTFGKLSKEALLAFEARLASDPVFAETVARESDLLRALKLSPEVDALREQLAALEAAQSASVGTRPPSTLRLFRGYGAVAAAVALLVMAVWFFTRPAVLTPAQLFVAHFQPPATLASAGKRNKPDGLVPALSGFQKNWAAADSLYAQGNFKEALRQYQQLAPEPEARAFQSRFNYGAGLTAMQAGAFQEAVGFLDRIPPTDYPTERPWYLALCQLRLGQLPEARQAFEQIAASASPFAGAAKQILQQLPEPTGH